MMMILFCFVLDQQTELAFYIVHYWNNNETGRHVTPLWHIILSLKQVDMSLHSDTLSCLWNR